MSPLRLVLPVLLALGIVASSAGAAVFQGSQNDVAADVLIAALPSVDLPNGGPPRIGVGSMDLSGASVSYDSGAGLLVVSFSGTAFVQTHSGTRFSGWVSSGAHQAPGVEQCLLGGPNTDSLTFTGSSGTGAGGGPGHGTATLWIPSAPGGSLDTAIAGVASFPVDWPEINQVVSFTFLDARLAQHAYLCATGLRADYTDHEDRNGDEVGSFCIVAGCFDPLESATPPPGNPPTGLPSTGSVTTAGSALTGASAPAVAPAPGVHVDARCSILPGRIRATTRRLTLMQRVAHEGSRAHRRAVARQIRILASRRTAQRATYKALCT